MRLIVQTDYDMLMLKNLLEVNIFSKYQVPLPKSLLMKMTSRHSKFLSSGMSIECQLIPEYKTAYRIIENNRADDLIDVIEELIREYKER